MTRLAEMLQTHPRGSTVDMRALQECIDACFDCAQACTACADACLAEETVPRLVSCIRLNLDCADICEVTGRALVRLTEPNIGMLRKQVEACLEACRVCAEECEKHAGMHEHCRVCAEACRRCEEACQSLLQGMMAGSQP